MSRAARTDGTEPTIQNARTTRGRTRAVRIAAAAIGVVAIAILTGGPASATWSVVATDPSTGQVGAAVASCSDVRDLTATMALVPKTGGAVSVGPGADTSPMLLASALRAGSSPNQVVAATDAANTAGHAGDVQYGVAVTGAGVGSTTGADTARTSGARVSSDGSASIQANGVVSPAVLDATKRAFDTTTGALGARLLAALNAGSAAGGDRSCGATARAASVVVLGTDSALFVPAASTTRPDVSDLLGASNLTPKQLSDELAKRAVLRAPRGVRAPELYLSSVVPAGGNALGVIDTRYAALTANANKSTAASDEIVDPHYSQGLTIAAILLFAVVGLILAALIITGLRRSDRNAQLAAAAQDDGTAARKQPFRGEVAQLFDVDIAAALRRSRENERRRQVQREAERGRERVRSTTSW